MYAHWCTCKLVSLVGREEVDLEEEDVESIGSCADFVVFSFGFS
jgi:hypothetical protein